MSRTAIPICARAARLKAKFMADIDKSQRMVELRQWRNIGTVVGYMS
jgi:hypothetical protein